MMNCGSRWAFGRAVKATGNSMQIYGTSDIYQTADTTSSGWDIELGVSGTATLYHSVFGIYSSQATGGILMTDVGGASVFGSQFGKLSILTGTGPAGIGSNKAVGARILGNVVLGISNMSFSGNAVGAVSITINTGISGIHIDTSNEFENGATITNHGTGSNFIAREIGTSANNILKIGDDSSTATITVNKSDQTQQWNFSGALTTPNNTAYRTLNAAGTTLFNLAF